MDETVPQVPFRVAIASNDGVHVNECFGRAWGYRIYEAGTEGFRLAEIRPGPTPCRDGSHDEEMLRAAVTLLADCQVVLAGRIGPGAFRLFADMGIDAFVERTSIEMALRRLAPNARHVPGNPRSVRCCGHARQDDHVTE